MNFIEYRMQRAALTADYRAKLSALDAQYTAQDRDAAKAARAATARQTRATTARVNGAYGVLNVWNANASAFRDGVLRGEGSASDLAEAKLACELRPAQYTYRELSSTRYEVTKIVTLGRPEVT